MNLNPFQKRMKGQQLTNFMVIAAAAFGGMGNVGKARTSPLSVRQKQWDLPRPCIKCGTKHTHNNAFCSAACCKEYAHV